MRVAEMDLNLVNCLGEVENKTTNYFKRISISYIFVLQMLLGCAKIWVPHDPSTQITSSEIYGGFRYPFENCAFRADFVYHIVIFCFGKERKSVIIHFDRAHENMFLQCKIPTEYQLNFVPDVNIKSQSLQVSDCRLYGLIYGNITAKFDVSNKKILEIKNSTLGNNSLSLSDEIFFGIITSTESLRLINISKSISENMFQNFPRLKNLTLVQNNIRDLGYFFENNEELRVLNLSKNHLKSLSDGVFKKLSNLQQLCLNTNELSMIRDNYFIGLSDLRSLDLSTNMISHIEENAFSNLTDIIEINLKSNQLKKISSNIFKNNLELENINLDSNPQLIVPDYAFANLRSLKSIKMSNSELENIYENTFENCSHLINLELQNNKFVQLPSGLLQPLRKLTTLNLGNNKLKFIPDNFFSTLENLEELNLESNQFSIINNITFVQNSLNRLKVLNLRRNRIVHIHEDAFSKLFNLVTFDLSYNHWKEETFYYFVSSSLEQFNYSHNNISFFNLPGILWDFKNLRQLDLSYNFLNKISVSIKPKNRNSVILNLSHNNISYISVVESNTLRTLYQLVSKNIHKDSNSLSTVINGKLSKRIRVDILDNNLICDCINYDFFKFFKGITPIAMTLKMIIDFRTDSKCLDSTESEYIPIEDISLQQLTCEDKYHCPAECTCFWRPYDETFVVDCSDKNLVIPPTLSINWQRVEMILTGNVLTSGPKEDGGYENVKILNLSNNKLTSFDWCPPHIERVNLSHNNLKMLNPGVLNTLNTSINFSQITLEHNPWVCDCSALEFQKFIQTHLQKVDSNDILCEDDQTALYKKNDICKSKLLIALILTVLTILLLISTVIACYWRYEREIKIWLYSKNWCLWIVSEEELDKDEKYDIFLSFSHKDEDFVIENLLPSLEKSFKLCIHSRDWVPGELINHQVVFSVYNSRRTVVVLSNDFLESAWGKLEFVMAHQRSMEEGRPRVIVIKLGDLNMDKMDDDFRAYMKTNTYVEWGDPWFWKKLMYSLPHSVIKNTDLPSDVICDFQNDGSLSQTRTTSLG